MFGHRAPLGTGLRESRPRLTRCGLQRWNPREDLVNGETVQVDDIQLTAQPSAVKCTDMFVRFTLTEWALRGLEDEAARIGCEAVNSVVRNANPDSPGFLTVRLRLRGDCLVIEVSDDQPAQQGALPAALSGKRAGVERLGHGKLVWCELPLPGGVEASAVPLPRRGRKSSRAASDEPVEQAEVDPQVIQRILSGLGGPPQRPDNRLFPH
jgi:hypothetical protein